MEALWLILAVCIVGVSEGQVNKMGKCPDIKTMPGFNLTMLSGDWNVIMKNEDFVDLFLKCIKLTFTLNSEVSYDVHATGLDIANNPYKNDATLTLDSTTNRIKVYVPNMAFESTFAVVHANTKSISIGFNCLQNGEMHSQYLWVFGRNGDVSQATASAIKNYCQRKGIDVSKLNIATSKCP